MDKAKEKETNEQKPSLARRFFRSIVRLVIKEAKDVAVEETKDELGL